MRNLLNRVMLVMNFADFIAQLVNIEVSAIATILAWLF